MLAESLIRNFYRCVEVSCLDTHTETTLTLTLSRSYIHTHTRTCGVANKCRCFGMYVSVVVLVLNTFCIRCVCVYARCQRFWLSIEVTYKHTTSFCKQTACSMLYSLSVSCSVYFSVSLTCFSHANKNSIGVCSEFAALFCRFSRSPKKTADVAFVYNLTAAASQTC